MESIQARPVRGEQVLDVRGLVKEYVTRDGVTRAVDGVDVSVAAGEFVAVVGPSGCGKSTLLKCISGLLRPTSGEIAVLGTKVDGPPPGLALVFQDYGRSLYPWMTVGGNIELPLKAKGLPRSERADLVEGALREVGLGGLRRRYPWELSGGMQQRVAIARAIAFRPQVLLMDEPFASVDAQTRQDLEDQVLQIRSDLGMAVLFVTHDIDEAVYVGDRIVVLSKSPMKVTDVVTPGLPSPRDQVETKSLPRFGEVRAHVLQLIRNERTRTAGGDRDV